MLCTKPYLLYREHQKIKAQGYHGLGANGHGGALTQEEVEGEDGVGEMQGGEEHEEFDMGEQVIHQIIRSFPPSLSPDSSN